MQSKFFSIKAGGTGLYPNTPLNDFYDLDLDSNSSPTKNYYYITFIITFFILY